MCPHIFATLAMVAKTPFFAPPLKMNRTKQKTNKLAKKGGKDTEFCPACSKGSRTKPSSSSAGPARGLGHPGHHPWPSPSAAGSPGSACPPGPHFRQDLIPSKPKEHHTVTHPISVSFGSTLSTATKKALETRRDVGGVLSVPFAFHSPRCTRTRRRPAQNSWRLRRLRRFRRWRRWRSGGRPASASAAPRRWPRAGF